MPDTKAIIRITAAPDSALRKALAGAVEAGRKASRQTATEDVKSAKEAEREKIRATRAAERAAAKAAASAIKAAGEAKRAQLRGAKEVERAMKQGAAAAARVMQKQATEAKRLSAAASREAAKRAAEATRLAAAEQRATERAETAKRRAFMATSKAAERGAGKVRREAEKTARAQIRAAERASKAQQRMAADQSAGRRRVLGAAGGALVGAGAAAIGRARAYGSTFGARSTEDMAGAAVDFKRRLAILADMGGIDQKQAGALEGKILQTSARTGVDAGELLAGLETAQDRFSDLKGFTAIIDQLADVSIAGSTSIESVVGAMGVMRRQFNLTDDEMQKLSGAMVQAADLGSISFDEFANNFASALGSLGRNVNLQGMGGAIKALAITQTLGKSDMTASESATLATNLVSSLTKEKVQKQVAKSKASGGFGVKLAEGGAVRDLTTLIPELAAAGFMDAKNSSRRQKAFPDKEARQAIEVLVTQFQTKPEEVRQLLSISPEEGSAAVKRRVGAATAGTLGEASTLGARQFATFMQSGGFQSFLDTAVKSADSLAKLEAEYPRMTEAVNIAGGALKGFAAALIAERLLMGGKSAAGAVAGAGGIAGLGAKLAGPAAAAGGGGIAAGALAAGAAGYGVTTGLLALTGGDRALDRWGAGLAGDVPRTSQRGVGPTRLVDQYNATAAIALQSRGGEPQTVELSPESVKALAANATSPEATLKIQVQGPAKVTSVRSRDFGFIDLSSVDTGHSGLQP